MKKKSLLPLLLLAMLFSSAQNVGINTTTPQASLDVRGSERTGGINNYVKFDSATGKIEWVGASLFTASSQQIIRHSASSEGLYAGGGRLDYRNSSGTPVFYSDWTNGNGYFSGNLGIGTVSPTAKLQIRDGASGISPFFSARVVVETNSHTYINLLSPDPFETGILFGSGTNAVSGLISYNSTAAPKGFIFNNNGNQTRMIIDNSGNVAIGSITPSGYGHGGNNRIMEINNPNTGSNNQSHVILSSNGTSGSMGGITWAAPNVPGSEKRLAFIGNLFETSNAARMAFYTRSESGILAEKMTILGNGNVGIGTSTPNTPLTFPPVLGKKITLYPGATGDAGMAVQGNLLQIYSDNPSADIAFGYDQAGTMIERLRIKANGNVGIGFVNPQFPLDITGRMRLSGANPNDPGIWLNDAAVDRAFIGLENNTYVGFYGNQGAGWKFGMNTQTGALKINGTEGLPGQVLQSNGAGTPPNWVQSTNTLYNNTVQVTGTGSVTTTDFTTVYPIPGLTYTFTVNTNAKVLVSGSVFVYANACTFCGNSISYIEVSLDGGVQQEFSTTVPNGYANGVSAVFNYLVNVSPGTHTIYLNAVSVGPSVTSSCNQCSNMILQIIPQ